MYKVSEVSAPLAFKPARKPLMFRRSTLAIPTAFLLSLTLGAAGAGAMRSTTSCAGEYMLFYAALYRDIPAIHTSAPCRVGSPLAARRAYSTRSHMDR